MMEIQLTVMVAAVLVRSKLATSVLIVLQILQMFAANQLPKPSLSHQVGNLEFGGR
jgi:hypothetical protein